MSIFSRASFIIIAISAPVLAIGNPGYYYPSYQPPYIPSKQISPPGYADILAGGKLNVLQFKHLEATNQPQATPTYTPPTYGPPVAYEQPTYDSPDVPPPPVEDPPPVSEGQAHNPLKVGTLVNKLPVGTTAPAPGQKSYSPPAEDIPAYVPKYTPTYDEPAVPKWGYYGKPSPLPHSMDRRNAPRVARTKVGKSVKPILLKGRHTRRRFPFLKKRQHLGQDAIVPVTVNMISGATHASTTSSVLTTSSPLTTTTASALATSLSPGNRVDTSNGGVSHPGTTIPGLGTSTIPTPSYWEGQHQASLDAGGSAPHRNKAAVVVSIISIIFGLIVLVLIVRLTKNALRKRKYPAGLGKYDEHSSKEGLITDTSEKVHFETHDVIVTRPDGSEISPLAHSRDDSPSPPPFVPRVMGSSLPPTPMPTFAPPPVPASPLAMPYVKLLSPTANLAQQNLVPNRASAASETMSMSTSTTDVSVRRSASDGSAMGRQLSHRRMRSAPGSVVWSARSSRATGKFTSGISAEEGYWDSVDVCGSESVSRMACRSSRGRSVAMSMMW